MNISAILFADDLVFIGKNKHSLDQLMNRRFFKIHRLNISAKKTKIMTKDGPTKLTFYGTEDMGPVEFKAVCKFKYLGISLDNTARGFIKG